MGTLFDKYKVLHRLPVKGQKVKCKSKATHHWFKDLIEREQTLLEIGKEYTVRDTELNSSSTYIWLEEFPDTNGNEERGNVYFSMGSFEWTPPPLDPQSLIGFSVRDLFRLIHKGINVDNDTFIITDGDIKYLPLYDQIHGQIYDIQRIKNGN